jgi:hypothetical protein
MKLFVYVWNDDTAVVEVENVLEATLGPESLEDLTIDTLQGGLAREHLPGDVVICFGKRCGNIIRAKFPQALVLPEMKKLYDEPANRVHREEARNLLKALKDGTLNQGPSSEDATLDLKPEDLADKLQVKNKNLSMHLAQDGTAYWIGTTALGKKIVLSDKPTTNIPCDFRLTFEELYAAKLAVDILGLKTLTLVKGKQDD